MVEGWRYYNHALIPSTAPHETVNETAVASLSFWKNWKGTPYLARWTTEFDCEHQTEWWYVIKDTPFDLDTIQSKKRYEIKKGIKYFDVRLICAADYKEDLYRITREAYVQYPEKYRPQLVHDRFITEVDSWNQHEVYGAFFRDNGMLCAYSWVDIHETYLDFCVLKADPAFEKYAVNAALVYAIVSRYSPKLGKDFYICDGARATVHETHFQDYLEKYFGFRKAYCKLKIAYPLPIRLAVRCIYPFRKLINSKGTFGSKVATVLFYEEIARHRLRKE